MKSAVCKTHKAEEAYWAEIGCDSWAEEATASSARYQVEIM